MANKSAREALRGVEEEVLGQILIEALTSGERWLGWLGDTLQRWATRGYKHVRALNLIAEALPAEEWAELLTGPLERAAGQGSRILAQKLVKAGAKIRYALHDAVKGGHRAVVNDLLESGASVNKKDPDNGLTPLHLAAEAGKTQIAWLLILKGADKNSLDQYGWTPLYSTTYRGRVRTALALMDAGADVNIQCSELQWSVAHTAAEKGHVAILRAAIRNGANVNAADIYENTALHHAAENNKVGAIDVLVEAGADIDARNDHGWTPLHCAVGAFSLEALATLIKHGACVNPQDATSQTPLHIAGRRATKPGAAEVLDFLLRSGADETLIEWDFKTPADFAAERIEIDNPPAEDAERVLQLLANAPADKAWRRRGYLVLCRAHPDRIQRTRDKSSSAGAGVSRRTRSASKLLRSEASRRNVGVGGAFVDERNDADWAPVVAHVLELQEEGIFRAIVRFL